MARVWLLNRGAVGERRREVERPPAERKSERALHFGRRIAHDLLFAVVVLVGQLTVPADENPRPFAGLIPAEPITLSAVIDSPSS